MATSVIDDADVALARAHAAEGEKYALYETTMADLYLVKAREQAGHAHYSDAANLATEAQKYAEKATVKAAERRTSTAAPPMPTANIQRPAEEKKPPPPVPPPEGDRKVIVPSPDKAPPPSDKKPKAPIDPGNAP
jgi:hypothetical protein